MIRISTVAIAVVLLALLMSGCGAQTTPAPVAAATVPVKDKASAALAQPTAEAKKDTPTPAVAEAAAVEAAATAPAAEPTADDSLSLASRDTGLDKLKSYHMQWQSQWQGVDDQGKADNASWDWVEEYSSDPQALHFVWKTTDSTKDKPETAFEVWEVGKVTYMATPGDASSAGEASCMSFSSDDQNQPFSKGMFSPSMLGSLHDAQYVGNESVNGIAAKHYRYDQKSSSLAGYGNVSGETWVAVDGGYVVKDVMKWEGGAGLFGANANGKGSGQWNWELSNVNQPIVIKPPDNCGSKTGDLPLLADASDKTTFGDMTSYKSATKLADAIAFYQKAMPDAGWQADGEPQTTDQFATLSFSKDQQKAQIMMTADTGTIQVVITVTKGQ